MKEYRVHYESKPGMWALYSGTKTVFADDEEEAVNKAFKLIERDFFDRPKSGWIFTVSCVFVY